MALQYNNAAMPLAGFAGGWTASSSNPTSQPGGAAYMANYNNSMAEPAGNVAVAQIQANSPLGYYTQNTQANMNYTNALNAQQIAQLQDAGATERLGMQTGSNETIAQGNYDTQKYLGDLQNNAARYQTLLNLRGIQDTNKSQLKGTDLATARALEGQLAGYDAQTEQARIGIQPQMEQIAFARDKWGDLQPILTSTLDRVLGVAENQGNGGGAADGSMGIPSFANVDADSLLNSANSAVYQDAGRAIGGIADSYGARGGTVAGSSNNYREAMDKSQIAARSQLAQNAVNVPLQHAQTMGPLQLQAAGLREQGRATRAQEDLSKQRIAQGYINSLLGFSGQLV